MPSVLFVVPPGRPPSGGDLYNRFLIEALRAAGFPVETTTLEEAGGPEALARFDEVWADSLYIPRLAETAGDGPEPRPRLFLIVHSLPSEDPGIAPETAETLRQAEDRVFAGSAAFLATGRATAATLRARAGRVKPILLVPPALCVRPRGWSGRPPVFTGLVASSLIRGKGVPGFLEALGRRVDPADEFRLRLAGRTDIEPGTAAACLASVRAHPLLSKRVAHLGHLPLDDLAREYERSSVFISPSTRESHGMAFHEARAFGLPVLAVRAAYSEPYVRSGTDGFLYDSPEDLAAGLLGLVRRPDQLREVEAAARARSSFASYGWGDAARTFLSQRNACGIVSSR